jgi:mycothiol synthase
MDACSRPYSGAADSERLRVFLTQARLRLGHSCWHVGDLVWRLFLHSIRYDLGQMLRLWEDAGGDLLGFAIVSPPTATGTICFDLQVDPQKRGQGLEERMLDWIEAWGRETMVETVGTLSAHYSTDTGVYDDDLGQIRALQRRGFAPERREGVLLLRPLGCAVPAYSLPQGFTVRAVAGPHEVEKRAGAHRHVFHSSRITDQAYLRLMQTPGYLPELDLVAVAPDGTFGAFCIGWLDEVNRVGEFEPVGTRSEFRRMGLAQAVLCEGLQRMEAGGAQSAVVGPVPCSEEAALRLYRSVGCYPIHRVYSYTREA